MEKNYKAFEEEVLKNDEINEYLTNNDKGEYIMPENEEDCARVIILILSQIEYEFPISLDLNTSEDYYGPYEITDYYNAISYTVEYDPYMHKNETLEYLFNAIYDWCKSAEKKRKQIMPFDPTEQIKYAPYISIKRTDISRELCELLWSNSDLIEGILNFKNQRILYTETISNIEYPSSIESEFKKILPDNILNTVEYILLINN